MYYFCNPGKEIVVEIPQSLKAQVYIYLFFFLFDLGM